MSDSTSMYREEGKTLRWIVKILYGVFVLFPFGITIFFADSSDISWLWKIVLAVFAWLGMIMLASWGVITEPPKVETEEEKAERLAREAEYQKLVDYRRDTTVSAYGIAHAYANNEVKADHDFKDKRFHVVGVIKGIDKDGDGNIYVTFDVDDLFRDVKCYTQNPNDVMSLSKGHRATFLGTCVGEGMFEDVLFKDCEIVPTVEF